jgi:hypothetical protein
MMAPYLPAHNNRAKPVGTFENLQDGLYCNTFAVKLTIIKKAGESGTQYLGRGR